MFSNLFGPRGLIVDSEATLPGEQPHTAHFASDFQFNFSQFSLALVSQLVSVPLPSPGGGSTFDFDPSLGVFQRTTQSFGPILAERAETIGARRFSMGYALQRFTFDSVEGIPLNQVPADNAFEKRGKAFDQPFPEVLRAHGDRLHVSRGHLREDDQAHRDDPDDDHGVGDGKAEWPGNFDGCLRQTMFGRFPVLLRLTGLKVGGRPCGLGRIR